MAVIPAPKITWFTVCFLILTLAHPIKGISGIISSIHLPNKIIKVITIKVIPLACKQIFQK